MNNKKIHKNDNRDLRKTEILMKNALEEYGKVGLKTVEKTVFESLHFTILRI